MAEKEEEEEEEDASCNINAYLGVYDGSIASPHTFEHSIVLILRARSIVELNSSFRSQVTW